MSVAQSAQSHSGSTTKRKRVCVSALDVFVFFPLINRFVSVCARALGRSLVHMRVARVRNANFVYLGVDVDVDDDGVVATCLLLPPLQ